MYKDREIFYLKADTESGIEGLVLKNREQHHYGTSDIGLLHDLLEHPYKPVANPYLDEIAALGAFNEFRCNQENFDILTDLRSTIYETYLQSDYRLKWDVNKVTELISLELACILKNDKEEEYYSYFVKYLNVFEYYFNLGATIFHNRFNNYFNSYSDLYYGLGDEVIRKLTPLVNTDLEDIKLTINYKEREVKVEY